MRKGYRFQVVLDLRRERAFWRRALVLSIARDSRVSGFPRLGEFKGLAVLQGPLRARGGAGASGMPVLSPASVLDAADDMGLLHGLVGSIHGLGAPPPGKTTLSSPFKALWVAAEFVL